MKSHRKASLENPVGTCVFDKGWCRRTVVYVFLKESWDECVNKRTNIFLKAQDKKPLRREMCH